MSHLTEEPLGYASMRERHRHRRKYKRRREVEDDGSEEERDNEEVLPRWKVITVFAIIGICFAMLFPNLFGPIFSTIFGRKDSQPQQGQQPHHPYMDRGAGQAPRPPGPSHRGPPRMPQAEIPQTGSRGGMMSWMLPIYTIGVMGFLVYTLFKMNNRKKKKARKRYDDEESDFTLESDEESDSGGFGRKKLRSIQNRLRETEEAMAKILEQLEEVAQASPENLTPEELRNKYSAEQMRQTERNLKELNRLNELRNRQQRMIEEEGGQISDAENEDNANLVQPETEDNVLKEKSPEVIITDADSQTEIQEEMVENQPKVIECEFERLPQPEIEEEIVEDQPKVIECEFEHPQDITPPDSSPIKSEEQPENTTTAFENQLFDFNGVDKVSEPKREKSEDCEAPKLLDDLLPDEVSTSKEHVSDSNRPIRQAKRNKQSKGSQEQLPPETQDKEEEVFLTSINSESTKEEQNNREHDFSKQSNKKERRRNRARKAS